MQDVSPKILEAFARVDRGHFWTPESTLNPYADMPIRHGRLHLSMPSVYAKVVEAFDLKEGMSFLNIGSGTGYFSSLVATITGEYAVNHGVELWEELVEHARQKCGELLGMKRVNFVQGDAFKIDVEKSMQYDCVYIGAGAESDARFLFKLVKPGGIVVGPFRMNEEEQSLRKARRVGNSDFAVWDVLPVMFQPLLRLTETELRGMGLHRRMVLRAISWTVHSHKTFPPRFKSGVMAILMAHKRDDTIISSLPKEIWLRIFMSLHRDWLGVPLPGQLCGACESSDTSAYCGRCKTVRYCSKACQRAHWKEHKLICAPASPSLSPSTAEICNTPRLSAASPPIYGIVNNGSGMSPFIQPSDSFSFFMGQDADFQLDGDNGDDGEGEEESEETDSDVETEMHEEDEDEEFVTTDSEEEIVKDDDDFQENHKEVNEVPLHSLHLQKVEVEPKNGHEVDEVGVMEPYGDTGQDKISTIAESEDSDDASL